MVDVSVGAQHAAEGQSARGQGFLDPFGRSRAGVHDEGDPLLRIGEYIAIRFDEGPVVAEKDHGCTLSFSRLPCRRGGGVRRVDSPGGGRDFGFTMSPTTLFIAAYSHAVSPRSFYDRVDPASDA